MACLGMVRVEGTLKYLAVGLVKFNLNGQGGVFKTFKGRQDDVDCLCTSFYEMSFKDNKVVKIVVTLCYFYD